MADRPNILLIMSDQHRADAIGCVGHSVVQTPYLDRLAAEGIRYDRAYCQGPLCMPARASFLTERYVRDHGVSDNTFELQGAWPTFVGALRVSGYHTAAIGKLHLYSHGGAGDTRDHLTRLDELGYTEANELVGKMASRRVTSPYHDYLQREGLAERYAEWTARPVHLWEPLPWTLGVESYQDSWVGRETVRWLEGYRREQPFFLQVGFPGPHSPWDAPPEYVDRYGDAEIPLGTTLPPERPDGPLRDFLDMWYPMRCIPDGVPDESIVACRRAYYAAITLIDEQIGAILAALERRGMLENTWIVYTSDHGEMMGDHRMYEKVVFYEPSVRIPLIVRPAGGQGLGVEGWELGRVVHELVEHIDLAATLRAVAGAGEVVGSAGRALRVDHSPGPADLTPRPPSLAGKGEPQRTRDASSTSGSANPESSARAVRPGSPFPAREGGRGVRSAGPGVRSVAISENHGFVCFITRRHKLIVWEDTRRPVALFDLEADSDEDRNLIDDPAYHAVREEMLAEHALPFLATPPLRFGPHMVERQRAAGGGRGDRRSRIE